MRGTFRKLDMWAEYKLWRNIILKEYKDPKIIWKCIHSPIPSNHIRPHWLVTENDLKVEKSIDIANTFNKFFTSCIENLRSENMSTLTNFSKLYNFVNDKIHNLLYPHCR